MANSPVGPRESATYTALNSSTVEEEMSETAAWLMLGAGVIVFIALSSYATKLWREVKRREALKKDEVRRANDNCLQSLELLATAMLNDQVDPIEGSLRCKVLLEIIDPALIERSGFRIFGEVHQRTSHLHTHSARRELSPRERMREDRERLAVEDELRDSILQAARNVLDFKQRWPSSLN
ncbi:DUF2489 domain-containing protein [Modicisalibacter xianhensis]